MTLSSSVDPIGVVSSPPPLDHITIAQPNSNLLASLQIETGGHSETELKLINSILLGMKLLFEQQLHKVKQEHAAEVEALKRRIVALEEKNDDLECYGRRNTMVISGNALPRALKDEDFYNIVVDMVTQNTGVPILRDDIDVCHRLGKPRMDGADKRSILVKFVRRAGD